MSTLTCEQALTLITEARDLRAEDSTALTEHLAGCDECRMGALSCAEAVSLMERALTVRGPRLVGAAVALASHLVRCDGCRGQAGAMLQAQTVMGLVQPPASLTARLDALAAGHAARQLRLRTFETPLGWTGLAYSDAAIVLVERSPAGAADIQEHVRLRLGDVVAQERPRDDIGEAAARKLVEYHEGRRVVFDEPMDLSLVPPFTRRVLQTTARIPYGEVRPYAWVAREVGKPRATRAVGQSLHINPLAPIIPCHRVIASDNTLGGYGGGLDMKRWLLRLEGYL
ncbi:MAG: methylated-DNA--[protein]-cysteine S-methyltransferase [Dehalococcoidia bacterium]|nr:methylated-DNA--[protein]-cysteine S-methyltransferase [Dehalococcoidia bacterium]